VGGLICLIVLSVAQNLNTVCFLSDVLLSSSLACD
jgi:hypothetical protein